MYRPLIFFIAILIISAIVTSIIAAYSWRRRQMPGAAWFALLMAGITIWTLGYALELWATTLNAKLFWVKFGYIGVVTTPVFWLMFALDYSGRDRWITRRNLILLSIIPLIILLLNWTNSLHYLYYPQVRLDTSGPFARFSFTTDFWYWVSAIYSYLLLFLSTVVLINMFLRSSRPYRSQIGIVLLGSFVPWIANIVYLFKLNPFPYLNLTPLAFTLTGLVMASGLFRFRLLDLVPIARDKVVESMRDGVIALDIQNRIIDINPAARRLIGNPDSGVVGELLPDFLTERPDLLESYGDTIELADQIVLGRGAEQRYYDLRISPLFGRRKELRGRLLVLHDITERKQAEDTLQALNRRMQDELALAYEIQKGLLPPAQPNWPDLDVVCYSASASQLGGDFYRYHTWKTTEHRKFVFAIGDVSGKGVSAALLMATSVSQFDASLSQNFAPKERLAYLDTVISTYTQPRGQNCALSYVELNRTNVSSASADLHIVNAGCIPPYIRRHANGTVDWPKIGGFPLGHGLGAKLGYQQIELQVSKGDLIILTSDGVAEATDAHGNMFGFERLSQTIAAGPNTSAVSMMDYLNHEIAQFTGQAEVHDDITIIVVQV